MKLTDKVNIIVEYLKISEYYYLILSTAGVEENKLWGHMEVKL